jgi:hypothetical protein
MDDYRTLGAALAAADRVSGAIAHAMADGEEAKVVRLVSREAR